MHVHVLIEYCTGFCARSCQRDGPEVYCRLWHHGYPHLHLPGHLQRGERPVDAALLPCMLSLLPDGVGYLDSFFDGHVCRARLCGGSSGPGCTTPGMSPCGGEQTRTYPVTDGVNDGGQVFVHVTMQ